MFLAKLQNTVEWIDANGHLVKHEIMGEVRARVLEMMQQCLAEPHCSNFSLMPEAT